MICATSDRRYVEAELRGDGVVRLIWTPNIKIDVADARAAMAMVNEVCNGVDHPMLVDMHSRLRKSDAAEMFDTTTHPRVRPPRINSASIFGNPVGG